MPKLSNEHIKLTPCLKMNVTLAAQVLISVSKVLLAYSPPEAAATARFCSLMDWFFDIMNIQNNQSHEFERKTMLAPIRSVNDQSFSWLCKVFFKSFHDDWILFCNAKETLQKMLARKCSYRCKHVKDWK